MWKFAVTAVAVCLALGGGAAVAMRHFDQELPDDRKVVDYHPPAGRPFIALDEMPPLVIHAFLAAEDADFYNHGGVDVPMLLRAAVIDVFRLASDERPIGASTITQQVVKNFLLTDRISLTRKIKEGLLAIRVERVLSKDRILEIYLNAIYLGCGAHGIAAAAHNYFGKPVRALTIGEAAFLAGLPKAPTHYNPRRFPRAAAKRRDWVLERMVENGYLTIDQASAAKAEPIRLSDTNLCSASSDRRPTRMASPGNHGVDQAK